MEDDPIREVERENMAAAERSNEREDDETHDEDQRCASCGHKRKYHWQEFGHCSPNIYGADLKRVPCSCEMFDDGIRSKCCNWLVISRRDGVGACQTCGAPVELP